MFQNLDGLVIVPEEGVETKESHEREVAHHLVEGVATEIPGYTVGKTSGAVDL